MRNQVIRSLMIFTTATAVVFSQSVFAKATQAPSTQELERMLVQVQSPDSIENSAAILEAALIAWNPNLYNYNLKSIFLEKTQREGVVQGLINPAITLIQVSSDAGKIQFGNLLNPMVKELSPKLARMLNKKYGLQLDYKGDDLRAVVRRNSRDQMIQSFGARLGKRARLGDGEYAKYQEERVSSVAKSNDKEPANLLTCLATCLDEIDKYRKKGETIGKVAGAIYGGIAGAYASKNVGGMLGSGKAGMDAGEGAGAIIGTAVGVDKCMSSKACGGPGKSPPEVEERPEPPAPPPPPPPPPVPAPAPKRVDTGAPIDKPIKFGPERPVRDNGYLRPGIEVAYKVIPKQKNQK